MVQQINEKTGGEYCTNPPDFCYTKYDLRKMLYMHFAILSERTCCVEKIRCLSASVCCCILYTAYGLCGNL